METLKKLSEAGLTRLEEARYGAEGASGAPGSTVEDEAVRLRAGFHRVEATLPTGLSEDKATATPLLDRVLSLAFGEKNPVAREADPREDSVWLFDTTAYRPGGDAQAHWEAEVVAAYFARHSGRDLTGAVSNIADKIGVDDGHLGESKKQEVRARIESRLRPFALSIRPARYIDVLYDGQATLRRLGPGNANGISTQSMGQLGFRRVGAGHSRPGTDGGFGPERATLAAPIPDLTPCGPATAYFAEPEGWAVVSDVDDSIKVTMTSSPIGMLQSTFYDDPTPIKGMPELYRRVDELLQKPAWFYLSASPYNLFPFLRGFLRDTYPHGTLLLRDASWQDLSGLLQCFTVGTQAYKTDRLARIRRWLPRRRLLCVGDSTQSDPEAYGAAARAHPGWIRAIFIRRVVGVRGMDEAVKNTPDRFERAWAGVDRAATVCKIFDDPQELNQAVEELAGGGGRGAAAATATATTTTSTTGSTATDTTGSTATDTVGNTSTGTSGNTASTTAAIGNDNEATAGGK